VPHSPAVDASGYDFLYSLLAAGTSISTPAQPYIGYIAPPAYIAFASSLVAYPKTTTKTHSRDVKQGSDAALRYLKCIHTTTDGPAYPTIRKAFSFSEEHSRRRGPAHRSAAASLSPEPGGDVERIAGDAANSDSLWTRAEDFWQLVGWAFNCSVLHKKRWDRWKLWLCIMLDFLEADWEFCVQSSKADGTHEEAVLQESLLWHYIVGDAGSVNRTMRRRIVKAILATASIESLKEYHEIWEQETEGPRRRKKDDKELEEVDFETGAMGDYDSDQEMQDAPEEPSEGGHSEESPSPDSSLHNLDNAVDQLGGMDAINLRQRLIALVSRTLSGTIYTNSHQLAQVTDYLPTEFTITSDFFDNILEDFIRLPTMTFKVLLSTSKLPDLLQVAFCANLLLPLVSGTIPDYFRYEPKQADFESTLLTLKGTTQSFAANAKISFILEQLLIYMMSQDALTATDALRKAMEGGIEARRSVKGKKRNAEDEDPAKILMEACSERLLGMLEVLEMAAGKSPQPLIVKVTSGPTFLSFGSGSPLSSAPDSDTEEDE
jgi:hypothetical protein